MKKATRAGSTRTPPEPSDRHADIDDWMRRVMPDLQPIVAGLDELIRTAIPGMQYAVKWKRAFYGVPNLGWVIEMVPYDVSVNVVFLAGADFANPPPLGDTGRSRYVKVRSLDEAGSADMQRWLAEAAVVPGWG